MMLPSISPEVRDWMQIGTAVVAVVAFIHTFYRAHKDRAHLRARSVIWGSRDDPDDPSLSLEVKVVNAGRRPVILKAIRGGYEDGERMETGLGDQVVLSENETFSKRIGPNDELRNTFLEHAMTHSKAVDIWFVDTLGRRWKIKNARGHIKLFLKSREEDEAAPAPAIEARAE
jgi:hypothetical protein